MGFSGIDLRSWTCPIGPFGCIALVLGLSHTGTGSLRLFPGCRWNGSPQLDQLSIIGRASPPPTPRSFYRRQRQSRVAYSLLADDLFALSLDPGTGIVALILSRRQFGDARSADASSLRPRLKSCSHTRERPRLSSREIVFPSRSRSTRGLRLRPVRSLSSAPPRQRSTLPTPSTTAPAKAPPVRRDSKVLQAQRGLREQLEEPDPLVRQDPPVPADRQVRPESNRCDKTDRSDRID